MLEMFKDDETTQWSLSRVSAATTLLVNFIYAAWTVFETGVMPDIGNNWLVIVLALYGINKTASTVKSAKAGTSEVQIG